MGAFITVRTIDQVHFAGDSITGFNWFSAPGGIVAQMNASLATLPKTSYPGVLAGGAVAATLAGGATVAVNRPVYQVPPFVTAPTLKPVTSAGFSGNSITDFVANVPARITNYNPDVLFLETGANDEQNFNNSALTVPQYITATTSVINQCLTFNPNMKICILAALCLSENWNAGPTWALSVRTMLPNLQTICAGYPNVVCADINTPALAYEVANNAPSPGAHDGILTNPGDGVHPSPTGQALMGTWTMPYLQFSY